MLRQFTISIYLLFAILFSSGCTVGTLLPDEKTYENDAFVVFTAHSDASASAPNNVTLINAITGKEISLSSSRLYRDGFLVSKLFVDRVPPGHYRIKTMESCGVSSSHSGEGMNLFCGTMTLNTDRYSFKVEEGRITYLGGIVISANREDRNKVAVVNNYPPDTRQLALLLRKEYQNLQYFMQNDILTWSQDNSDLPLALFHKRIRTGDPRIRSVHDLGNGVVAFGNTLGVIRFIDLKTGDTRALDTGSTFSIEAITTTASNEVVVGGENLALFAQNNNSWQNVAMNGDYGVIRALHFAEDGRLFAIVFDFDYVHIYAGTIEKGLKQIATREFSWYADKGRDSADAFFYEDKVIISNGRGNQLWVYNIQDGQSEMVKAPGEILDFSVDEANGDISCQCMKWGGGYLRSKDMGETWEKIGPDLFEKSIYDVSTSTVMKAIPDHGYFATFGIKDTRTTPIYYSENLQGNWNQVHATQFVAREGRYLTRSNALLFWNTFGRITFTLDQGETWQDAHLGLR